VKTPLNGNGLQVLVVDDSAMVRQVMQAILATDRRINVKAAADPLIAWGKNAEGMSRCLSSRIWRCPGWTA